MKMYFESWQFQASHDFKIHNLSLNTFYVIRLSSLLLLAVSAATSVTLTTNRLGLLYWGTTLTLTCIVNYNTELVDTPVTFNINITGPVTNIVSTGSSTNVSFMAFEPLLPEHEGSYECLSSIIPSSQTPFVTTVMNESSKPLVLQLTG